MLQAALERAAQARVPPPRKASHRVQGEGRVHESVKRRRLPCREQQRSNNANAAAHSCCRYCIPCCFTTHSPCIFFYTIPTNPIASAKSNSIPLADLCLCCHEPAQSSSQRHRTAVNSLLFSCLALAQPNDKSSKPGRILVTGDLLLYCQQRLPVHKTITLHLHGEGVTQPDLHPRHDMSGVHRFLSRREKKHTTPKGHPPEAASKERVCISLPSLLAHPS